MGTIYFIRMDKGPVKIGYTEKNVEHRVRQLQTGSPHKLVILATAEGTKEDERQLHNRFADYNIKGEWFKCVPEIMSYIFPVNLQIATYQNSPKENIPIESPKIVLLAEIERIAIIDALEANNENKSQTARDLGITRRTLHKKLKKYGLMPETVPKG